MEQSPKHEHGRSRTGVFQDMRSSKIHQATDPLDVFVERESLIQIANDVRRRVHKWNVYYYGVVRNEDVPDTVNAKSSKNCKDESYRNIFLFGEQADNGYPNVSWCIFPPQQ